MDFENGFRLSITGRYGTKFWYSYEEHLRILFKYYATQKKEVLALDESTFILLCSFLEEVIAGWTSWTDHSAFQNTVPIPRGSSLSKLEFHQKVERHQMDALSRRLKKIF